MSIALEIEFPDESVYTIEDELWLAAVLFTYEEVDFNLVAAALTEETKRHYENETVPTEVGFVEEWTSEEIYNSQAELAPEVLYPRIGEVLELLAERQPLNVSLENVATSALELPQGKDTRDDGTEVYQYDGSDTKRLLTLEEVTEIAASRA